MRFPALLGALALVVASTGTAATALTLAQAATPAETPPASYSKDIYVDSRGCVYVRASIGTTVNWVPRLSRDRETVVCGLTQSAAVASAAAPPPAPAAASPATGTAVAMAAAPTSAAPSRPAPAATSMAGVTRTMDVTCPANGSTARVQIGGDTVKVRCPAGMTRATSYVVTHGDGSRSRLVAHPAAAAAARPSAQAAIGAVAPAAPGSATGVGLATATRPVDPAPHPAYTTVPAVTAGPVQIPAGYGPAWDDDRLNPDRGPRTAYGDAQMGVLFDTAKVPMPGAEIPALRRDAPPPVASPKVAPGARYVQVGAFGVSANAQRAIANLRGLGFGAATSRTRSGLTLVMAGPFASAAELQRALATLRGHYPDAYTRG